MNDKQLKSRAVRLTNRLNAMGFTKNNEPMVVDQAFELVAAEEGHRNQHVLRKLLNPVSLSIPVVLDEGFAKALLVQHTLDGDDWSLATEAWELIVAEAADRAGVAPVTDEQERSAGDELAATAARMGWGERDMTELMQSFLAQTNQRTAFAAFVSDIAANTERVTETARLVTIKETLQAVGYKLVTSDFRKPYWEFYEDASEDFPTADDAWLSAWGDAQRRTLTPAWFKQEDWNALSFAAQVAKVTESLPRVREAAMRAKAADAFEAADFGNRRVVTMNGWETQTGSPIFTRTVFLRHKEDGPDAASVRYTFSVDVDTGITSLTS